MNGGFFLTIPIFFPITLLVIAVSVSVTVGILLNRLIRQQVRLHNCINLVELKSPKVIYYVFFFAALLPIVYAVFNIAVPSGSFLAFCVRMSFGMLERIILLSALILIFTCLALLMLTLALSKCALVDKGVYTKVHFYDWYQICDYYVDEENNYVILSRNNRGSFSFKGMSPPLKFRVADIEKLKFILNRNKNKFLKAWELR